MARLPESLRPYTGPMDTNASHQVDDEATLVRRKLSRRGTVLRALGVGFMGLSGLADWLALSDPTVPFIPTFLLTVGVLVFVSGLALSR
jgi:hypothetical protein